MRRLLPDGSTFAYKRSNSLYVEATGIGAMNLILTPSSTSTLIWKNIAILLFGLHEFMAQCATVSKIASRGCRIKEMIHECIESYETLGYNGVVA